jgi:hypothetical protein
VWGADAALADLLRDHGPAHLVKVEFCRRASPPMSVSAHVTVALRTVSA